MAYCCDFFRIYRQISPSKTRNCSFNKSDLSELDEALNLALEVGLLSIYEGTTGEIERYKVPDLYRLGIGMTRKGQA
jgi:hypothetical protein